MPFGQQALRQHGAGEEAERQRGEAGGDSAASQSAQPLYNILLAFHVDCNPEFVAY